MHIYQDPLPQLTIYHSNTITPISFTYCIKHIYIDLWQMYPPNTPIDYRCMEYHYTDYI